MKLQKDRIYSLVVGNENGAVEINNLQMRFSVTKTSDNKEKKNSAYVEIYNLSESTRKSLEEDYVRVSLKVGYFDTGLTELFSGEVVDISNEKNGIKGFRSKRQNTDIITRLEIDELYTQLNATTLSKIVPAGVTVKSVILKIIEDIPEIIRHEMSGQKINKNLPDGYPLSGTPRQNLDKLSKEFNLEWQIDNGVLRVTDQGGSSTRDLISVPKIGQMSGLIKRPEYISGDSKEIKKKDKKVRRKNSLRFTILLNPTIVPGSIIKLEFEDLTGLYRVDEVKHSGDFRGDRWESQITCTEKL